MIRVTKKVPVNASINVFADEPMQSRAILMLDLNRSLNPRFAPVAPSSAVADATETVVSVTAPRDAIRIPQNRSSVRCRVSVKPSPPTGSFPVCWHR